MSKRNTKRPIEEEEEEEEEFDDEEGGMEFPMQRARKELSQVLNPLAPNVRDRVRVLRKLQGDYQDLRKKFEEEARALQKKYEDLYKPLFVKRSEVVKGEKDVSEDDLKAVTSFEDEEAKQKAAKVAVPSDSAPATTTTTTTTTTEAPNTTASDAKGIPEFWLAVLKNSEIYDDMVKPYDEDALKFLVDVTSNNFDDGQSTATSKGFTIEFTFAENPYFDTKVLIKSYYLNPEDGASIEESKGCDIAWKEGKNLTVKTVIKKQKHKSGKNTRKVKKEEPQDSFFNFFKTIEEPENEEEEEEFDQLVDADLELGQIFKERIIPLAVQYYTDEIPLPFYDMSNMQFGDDGDDEDQEDGDDNAAHVVDNVQQDNNPECKQQ